MRTRFKSLLALGLTFAAGCFVGIVIGSSNPRWFKSFRQPPGPCLLYTSDAADE